MVMIYSATTTAIATTTTRLTDIACLAEQADVWRQY